MSYRLFSTFPLFLGMAFANIATAGNIPRVYTDSDKRIIAYEGDTFVIKMPVNPSTGYSLTVGSLSLKNVELLKSEYTHNCPPRAVGCGGFENFYFKVIKKGTEDITITHGRTWEPSTQHNYNFKIVAPFTIEDREINVTNQKEFTLRLPRTSLSEQISWVQSTRNPELLRLSDERYLTSCTNEPLPNCGRQVHFALFTFQALQVGASDLHFSYSRLWDVEPSMNLYNFKVQVSAETQP